MRTSSDTAGVTQAKKALQGASGGFSFFGGGKEDKLQNAAELYVQAGNAYKMERMSE